MTDIVERLRRFGAVVQGRDPKDYAVPVPAVLIIETADEIERLREACKNASSYISVRDQFAMAALPVAAKAEGRLLSDDIARMAYELADSMIKTRAALGEKE